MTNIRPLVFASLLAVTSTAAAQSPSAVQHFDRDPGWEGRFNRTELTNLPEVVQDFGYSRTNHAGQGAGEVGGHIQRTARPA